MTLRRLQLAAVAVVLFTCFFASGVAQPTSRDATGQNAATTNGCWPGGRVNWTFEGCWTQFPAGTCRDVFRDQQGNYWICRECGTTGNPGPGKCSPISQATLASGFWCS